MPVELRPRKVQYTSSRSRRRSTRLHRLVEYGLISESYTDNGTNLNEDMDSKSSLSMEGVGEGAHAMSLRSCSVVLDRVREEEITSKELEEKEDTARKSGRPVSRIPTFQSSFTKKRFPGSQNPEQSLPDKDTDQPLEKAAIASIEVAKSRVSGNRETALPVPSVRISPKAETISQLENTSVDSHTPPPGYSVFLTSEDAGHHPGVVTPRPALRVEQGHHGVDQDALVALLPEKVFQGGAKRQGVEELGECDTLSGETAWVSGGSPHQEKSIMDEEPPWETDQIEFDLAPEEDGGSSSLDAGLAEDRGSSSLDAGLAEDRGSSSLDAGLAEEPSDGSTDGSSGCESEKDAVGDYTGQKGVLLRSSDATEAYTDSVVPHTPVSETPGQSTKTWLCSSFTMMCLLPTCMLLLGVGHHVWHYGLPWSVGQLVAQLELHWYEGAGLLHEPCSSDCRVHLVETIPVGLYPDHPLPLPTIADSWLGLLHKANSSVNIAAFYFTLRRSDLQLSEPLDSQGRKVLEQLAQLEPRGVKLEVAVNAPQTSTKDTSELTATGATVREIDLQSVTGGIVHTKMWVVDRKHMYLGSANMDWRSLSQVKEVGLAVEDCSCLARDAFRIFGVYWTIGASKNGSLPPYWPARLSALSSALYPLHLKFNGVPARVYLSSAPPPISARGRSDDLSSILSIILDAQRFVYISVMDYLPMTEFTKPQRFWPAIDSALRDAACSRRVEVRLLVSCWPHSRAAMFVFLQSLLVLNRPSLQCNINVKLFVVPSTEEQKEIPYARVNHAKYMVTDQVAYIGTSNWSENYFTHTAGVGLVVNQTGSVVGKGQMTLQSQVREIFVRDWTSQYASTLSVDDVEVCPHSRQ